MREEIGEHMEKNYEVKDEECDLNIVPNKNIKEELNEDEYAIINYLKKNSLDISKLQSNLLKISIIFSIVTIVYSFLLKIKK